MANIFKKLFGFEEKRDVTPNIGAFQQPVDTQAGRTALDILRPRARGQGVSFTPEQISEMFGPATAQRRFERDILPSIESAQGAANIASTPQGVGQTTLARQRNMDTALEALANRQFQNEANRQTGITGALSGLQNFTNQELAQSNLQTQADWQNYLNQIGREDARRGINRAATGRALEFGANAGLAFLGGGTNMGGGGISQYGNYYPPNTPEGVVDTGSYSRLPERSVVQGGGITQLLKRLLGTR